MTSNLHSSHGGQRLTVKPYDNHQVTLSADVYTYDFGSKDTTYTVNWPGIGSVTTEEARTFAAAIVFACDWLDEQKKEVGNAG